MKEFMEKWNISFDQVAEMGAHYGIRILGAIALIFTALIVAGTVKRMTIRSLNRIKFDATLTHFFGNLSKYVVLLLAGLACLSVFGVETTSFAAVIGAAGLAVGLGFQGTLSNFSAGVMLLIFRPFAIGNFVNIGGSTSGTVAELGLFSTHLDTPDNRRIIVPNGKIFGADIENVSHHGTRRCDIAVGTAYEADIDQTRQVLESVVASVAGGKKDPAPQVFLAELGASSIDWALRVWCDAPDYWNVRQALVRDTKIALDQAGIGIPYPQMDVRMPK